MLGDLELVKDKDYTVNITYSDDGSKAIVSITGIGNFNGFISQKFDVDKPFNHWVWIIPTATVVVLGLAFASLMIAKAVRAKKKKLTPSVESTDDAISKDE